MKKEKTDDRLKNTGRSMLLTYEHPADDPDEEEKGGIITDDVDRKVYYWIDN